MAAPSSSLMHFSFAYFAECPNCWPIAMAFTAMCFPSGRGLTKRVGTAPADGHKVRAQSKQIGPAPHPRARMCKQPLALTPYADYRQTNHNAGARRRTYPMVIARNSYSERKCDTQLLSARYTVAQFYTYGTGLYHREINPI